VNRYESSLARLRAQQATTPAGHGLPLFDGATLQAEDEPRLSGQRDRVYRALFDGRWHTLSEIHAAAGGKETAVSARIRDLRKKRYGQHTIDIRCLGGGLWEYRLTKGTHP
jgi:hypothetical protein